MDLLAGYFRDKEVAVVSRWPIRSKLLLVGACLVLIVGLLVFCSLKGVYAFRGLARTMSYQRASELRLASQLSWHVGELRSTVNRVQRPMWITEHQPTVPLDSLALREDFREEFNAARQALEAYKEQLRLTAHEREQDGYDGSQLPEWETVGEIECSLEQIATLNDDEDWTWNEVKVADVDAALATLHTLTLKLPIHLQERMQQYAGEVRGQYRTWIVLTWVSVALVLVLLVILFNYVYSGLFKPLHTVIQGSRRVSRDGDFHHRIHLDTHDEVAELAEAMNDMTNRFQTIRDDLDEQVKQRTRQVVRSEQLASVGFLAAGVSHEINNPLATIAWGAEAIEMRLQDLLPEDEIDPEEEHSQDLVDIYDYLRKIHDEAFRCKGITGRLLSFARKGEAERVETDLRKLVQDVIETVQYLGEFRQRTIAFHCDQPVWATVADQEIKQVVLNLIVNALHASDEDGRVDVDLRLIGNKVELTVRDNGCGMTDEVLQHLFEPFFTNRRNGQGIGLGLSISYRIIQDHRGEIIPTSDGPDQGSQFRVILPVCAENEQSEEENSKKVA